MEIRKSAEDYLEMMLMLQEKHGYIRSIDIAEELGVKKPSVSYATKRLKENGYITMNNENLITLTGSGMEIASRIYERHKLLTDILIALGIDGETARTDACKIEHDLSEKSFEAIRKHVKEFKNIRN
ncbi:MAG: metal-dependent transcriptional regulator [Clostridiaceae bacterium]|jgi:Mn-dependent DtxR family transcriptional regulator|nr:metal-dependent transcriptional regulator [Clostridiaceae bacterium]